MSRRFNRFADFATALERLSVKGALLPTESAHLTAPVLSESVKSVFGHTTFLQDLAPSTQAERQRLGFTPNDPLVRTGELRASVVPGVGGPHGTIAGAGSPNPLMHIHEHGSGHIPPRPAMLIGLRLAQPTVRAIVKRLIKNLF